MEEEGRSEYHQHELSNDEITRYGRQLILTGVEWQVAVKKGRVLVVGAGGLGSPCLAYLCAAGVGTLGIVDHDVVDQGNLHRQVLHNEASVGKTKAASGAAFLRAMNHLVQVVEYPELLSKENALRIIEGYHVVVDCTDNVPTRYLLNDCCVILGLPLVSGSALGLHGQLTVYHFDHMTPCYRCMFPKPPPPESVVSCSDGGVLGAITGVIGSMQALEVLKVLSRASRDTLLAARLLTFNGERGTFRTAKLRSRVSGCLCGADDPQLLAGESYEQFCHVKSATDSVQVEDLSLEWAAHSVTVTQLKEWMDEVPQRVTLIDVRNALQFRICHLKQAVNIPLSELTPQRVADVVAHSGSAKVVFICRRGIDSQKALVRISNALQPPIPCFDCQGGLQQYARIVDPAFPVY